MLTHTQLIAGFLLRVFSGVANRNPVRIFLSSELNLMGFSVYDEFSVQSSHSGEMDK